MRFDDVRRRSYLASMAGGMAALAGCPGDGGEATESSPESPTPDSRQPNVNDMKESVQKSANGMVVPVFAGASSDAAIDPSTTETPIQDAIDTIESGSESRLPAGAVLLPPGQITEAGPLLRTRFKRFLGWGTVATVVQFTDPTAPGIAQDPEVRRDAQRTYWDGIRFLGGGGDLRPGDRTAPWLHLEDHFGDEPNSIGGFNVGRLRLDFWGDPVVHFDGSFIFESHWEWLELKNGIYGRALLLEDGVPFGGSGWTCDKLNLRRSDSGRIVDARESGGGSFSVQSLHAMHTEPGGSQSVPALDLATVSGLGELHFNQLHYECRVADDGDHRRMPSLVRASGGGGRLRIDELVTYNGSYDYLVELTESLRQVRLGRLFWGEPDLRETPIRITGQPPGGWYVRGNILYDGPSQHITDETDSQYGHVYALGDRKVADPLFSDTVTHTTGGETRIHRINDVDRQRAVEKITPQIQTLEPASMPGEPFGVDHRFEWVPEGSPGRWDLILTWTRDPGIDVEFDVEVTARSADGHGVPLRGRE